MSSMIVSSDSPLVRMVSTKSRWSGASSACINNPVIAITPFIGVRISWLIVARNSALPCAASSAAIRAVSRR